MQQSTHIKQRGKQHMSSVSFSDGYWFYFEDGDTDIAVNASAWSGKEVVYVNDNPVSENRVIFRRSNAHEFVHNGKHYRVTLTIKSLLTGRVQCELYIDGTLFASNEKAYVAKKQSKKQMISAILIMFVVGLAVGYGTAELVKYISG